MRAQSLANEATILILVDDVNDEFPEIMETEQLIVFEEEPAGTFVTRFLAS